jgi:pantetheine-phosphate adenylyltransferase
LGQPLRSAVYAGTFDPITNGHVDIVSRALRVFDVVYVAVAESTSKSVMFSTKDRVLMVEEAVRELGTENVLRVQAFDGLLVKFVESVSATVIIRGLRAVSDYEYEAQMAHINRRLAQEIETVFLVTSDRCSFISSSIVKNVAGNGGDVSGLVPSGVVKRLQARTKGD